MLKERRAGPIAVFLGEAGHTGPVGWLCPPFFFLSSTQNFLGGPECVLGFAPLVFWVGILSFLISLSFFK